MHFKNFKSRWCFFLRCCLQRGGDSSAGSSGAVLGRGEGSSLFLYFSQPKFRGEVPCTTQPPGSANALRHKRSRTPRFTLQALPCPGASGLRELASSRPGPAGRPGGIAAGGTAGTTHPRHTNQLPPPAQHGRGAAGAQPALKAEAAAVHAL